jgi:beta-lactamase regulating signal transducer with metallopeptidase domain
MNDPAYPANFAVQAILLSVFSLVLVACLRRPERRASAALMGMLACGVIPFVSAWVPVTEGVRPGRVIQLDPMLPVAQRLAVEPMVPTVFPEPVAESGEQLESAVPPAAKIDPQFWILRVWMAGSLAGALLMIGELIRTRRWLRTLVAPDEREWDLIRHVAPEGFGREQIRISAAATGPCVVGFWKPRIVIPGWLLDNRHHRELDWTLRHELEHLRCHDSRWVHVIRAICIVQWWNPLLHRLIAVWAQAREQACDLRAIRDGTEGPDYGHFLLKVAGEKPSRFAAAMAVTGDTKRLRRRITGLLKSPVPKPAPVSAGWQLAMGGLMVGVAFFTSAFGFARAPQAAGAAAEDDMSWLEPKPIVHVRAMAVIAPEPFARHGEVLTKEEVKKRMERFARLKDCHVMSLSEGQIAGSAPLYLQVTANRDDSLADPPWDGDRRVSDFIGWVMRCDAVASADDIGMKITAAYAFVPGWHPAPTLVMPRSIPEYPWIPRSHVSGPQVLPNGAGWQDVRMKTTAVEGMVHSGDSLCISLGEVESGVYAVAFTEVLTRMPWEEATQEETAELRNGHQIQVEVRTLPIELTAEQKKLQSEIGELRDELAKKVDALPRNSELLKIRSEVEGDLIKARLVEDQKRIEYLCWRIQTIRKRMWDQCPLEYHAEKMLIARKQSHLNEVTLKELIQGNGSDEALLPGRRVYRGMELRRPLADPGNFNYNEQ